MAYSFAVKTSPNMIGLTVKNIIIKKQLNFFFKVPGVLFCTTVSMSIDWFIDVPPTVNPAFNVPLFLTI